MKKVRAETTAILEPMRARTTAETRREGDARHGIEQRQIGSAAR